MRQKVLLQFLFACMLMIASAPIYSLKAQTDTIPVNTVHDTICNNQLPTYTFLGESFLQGGTFDIPVMAQDSSESRDFEQEISYLNKNQITHRASLNKRELKYSIKTTKNSSLIGISDLIIPSSIISKRENVYDKTCSIAMSDSVKRVLFGNTSPICILLYNTKKKKKM